HPLRVIGARWLEACVLRVICGGVEIIARRLRNGEVHGGGTLEFLPIGFHRYAGRGNLRAVDDVDAGTAAVLRFHVAIGPPRFTRCGIGCVGDDAGTAVGGEMISVRPRVGGVRVEIAGVDVVFGRGFCLCDEKGGCDCERCGENCDESFHINNGSVHLRGSEINSTTACDSAERPSPTGPTRLTVLDFTETRSTVSSMVCARDSRIGSRKSLSFGRSRITIESTLTIR